MSKTELRNDRHLRMGDLLGRIDAGEIDTVIVAVHVHGNDTVGVIGPLDDQGSIIFVSIATTRSRRAAPTSYCSSSMRPSIFITSRCAADSIAEPLAIV